MRYTICIILYAHIANSFTFTNRNVGTKLKLPATLDGQTIEGELAPTNNFILVKIADVQEETAGGIFLTGKVCMCLHLFINLCKNVLFSLISQ